MNRRAEYRFWTGGTLILGLVTMGAAAWVMTEGAKYIAPGVLAALCGAFLVFMAFAGRQSGEG